MSKQVLFLGECNTESPRKLAVDIALQAISSGLIKNATSWLEASHKSSYARLIHICPIPSYSHSHTTQQSKAKSRAELLDLFKSEYKNINAIFYDGSTAKKVIGGLDKELVQALPESCKWIGGLDRRSILKYPY